MEHDVKDMLEIAIANNDSLWEVAVIDRLQGELERLYSQEAKAKAWDRVYVAFEKAENEHEFSNGVCTIMNEYESGESDG